MGVHSNFICNNSKLQTTEISINRWGAKQIVVYPHYGKLLSDKKEWATATCNNFDEYQNNYAEWSRTKKKKNAYYEFIYIKVPYSDKNANFCSDRNQVSSFLCSILEGAN